VEGRGRSRLQNRQTIAASWISSAQKGHRFIGRSGWNHGNESALPKRSITAMSVLVINASRGGTWPDKIWMSKSRPNPLMPYDPFGTPPKRADVQRSVLWTLQKNDHTYACELKFWDGGGTEAQILKDGDLLVSRRFEEGWQTLQWPRRSGSLSRAAASEHLHVADDCSRCAPPNGSERDGVVEQRQEPSNERRDYRPDPMKHEVPEVNQGDEG
jgi:hypothetical protein